MQQIISVQLLLFMGPLKFGSNGFGAPAKKKNFNNVIQIKEGQTL